MTQLFVQHFVDVKRKLPDGIDHRVSAQHFEIESISVESDDSGKRAQLHNQFRNVVLEPTPERVVLVPSDSDRDAELANVSPSAVNFMRKPERLNVEINFPREEVH